MTSAVPMSAPEHYTSYTVKWATLRWESERAFALRRRVFCEEQRIFHDDDRDEVDRYARVLVALGSMGGWHQELVGTVRIHQEGEGLWYGSRLAVAAGYRGQSSIGSTLIRLAVSSAHGLGCREFLATVQIQNETLFQRLGWHTAGYETIHGVRHALMSADLNQYPPCLTPNSGFTVRARVPVTPELPFSPLLDPTFRHAVAPMPAAGHAL